MKTLRFALALSLLALPFALPATGRSVPAAAPVHCQVPCGIYGDKMRIDMLMEDAATIEKGMKALGRSDLEPNQMVRWILTKDEHAQKIQDQVAAYWLAQRIKVPAEGSDAAAMAKYHTQLGLLHRLTVEAMKCKQTTDPSHVANLRRISLEFSETYFSADDLEHIRGHRGSGER